MTSAPPQSLLDPKVAEGVRVVLAHIGSIKKIPLPNEAIDDFEFPNAAVVDDWEDRLASITRENFIEEMAALISEVRLPILNPDEARHDHLKIYLQLSQLQEGMRGVISQAIECGYPHSLNLIAETADITPQLKEILQLLTNIQRQTDKIEQQTTAKISDGIAVAIGPVSATLTAINQAAAIARQKIQLDNPETNVSAVLAAISRVTSASDKIVEQLQTFARDVPQWLRAALKGIVALGNEIAGRSRELLQRVKGRAKRTSALPISSAAEAEPNPIDLSEQEAREVGAALRDARTKDGISVGGVARYLKIRLEHVAAIEAGKFSQLPGRTYAIGWVRAYAHYLGIDPETLLASVRRTKPW